MSQANQQPAPDEQDNLGRSPSQAEIELLQATIQRLEGVLEQLSTTPQAQLPPLTSLQTLATSSEELAASLDKVEPVAPPVEEEVREPETIEPSPAPQEVSAPEETVPTEPKPPLVEEKPAPVVAEPEPSVEAPTPAPKPQLMDRVLPSFARLEAWWEGVLKLVRSVLPASIKEKLSDKALTGILTGTLVAVLLVSVLLLPEPSQPEIGEVSSPQETLPEIKTPPQLEAPGKEQPIATSPAPVPKLELTPEQSLIAAIQAQVNQITDQYAEGLIQSLEANFRGSRLIVQVGDDWYELEDSRQNQLANEMLRRSQEVDFRHLEIVDLQGTLLARSPVVGQEMVILQRHR